MKLSWWQLILIIISGGLVFYLCYPKYHFASSGGIIVSRCNKITGSCENLLNGKKW